MSLKKIIIFKDNFQVFIDKEKQILSNYIIGLDKYEICIYRNISK